MQEINYLLENPRLPKYAAEMAGSTAFAATYRVLQHLRPVGEDDEHREFSKSVNSTGITAAAGSMDQLRGMIDKTSLFEAEDYAVILSGLYLGQSIPDNYLEKEFEETGFRELLEP